MTLNSWMMAVEEPLVETHWRAHGDALLRLASALVGPSDAPDVAVDAFLRAASRTAELDPEATRAYLQRAVINRAHDLHRSRGRRWRRDLAAVGPAVTRDADPHVDVRRAVSELSLAQRTVVYLVYWEDRTERDVAAVLGVSPGTVRRHLIRARDRLRKAL